MRRQPDNWPAHRSKVGLAAATVGLLTVVSCGGGGSSAGGADPDEAENMVSGGVEADSEPVNGGSVTVALESETNSYLPSIFQGSQAGYNVAYAVYDPLFTRDGDGELQPYLAESMEPNDDFTEWTLTLPDGVTFHDGTPLNAEAIQANFDDYLTADGANTTGALRDVEEMEIVSELSVRYVLSQPHSAFPDVLTGPAGWPFSPTAADEMGDAFGDQPVGTGPFEFVSWQRDGALEMERYDDYWQEGQPYLDAITFRSVPDEETRATSLETGGIDAAQSVRLSSFLARVRDLPGVEVAMGMGNGAGNVMFNTTAPPFDDVRVRQAAAHAIDQQAVVDVVADEAAEMSELRTQHFPSDSPWYSEAAADAWPEHDPERATELLDEYINDPGRSDGESVGTPVSFQFDATNVPSLVQQGRAYEGLWEEVGFEVDVEPVEQSVHIQEALTGDYQAKSYRGSIDNDPIEVFELAFGDPDERITNMSNYHNDTVVDVVDRLRTSDDEEERAEAVEELAVMLAEEVPYYWTASDLAFIAHREEVSGIASWTYPDGTLGDGATPAITFWGQVWVEE